MQLSLNADGKGPSKVLPPTADPQSHVPGLAPGTQADKALGRVKRLFQVPWSSVFESGHCLQYCTAGFTMPRIVFLLQLLSFPRGRAVVEASRVVSTLSPCLFPCLCAQPGITCSATFVSQTDISEATLAERHCSKHFRVTQGILPRS